MVANLEIYLPICILKIGKTTNKMGNRKLLPKNRPKKNYCCANFSTPAKALKKFAPQTFMISSSV